MERSEKRCYNCNGLGHISRNCPVRGRAAPVESRQRKDQPNVSVLTVKTRKRGPTDLRTIHRSSKTNSEGLVLKTEVCVEGSPIRAFVDSGSQVTILSLDVLLDIWKIRQPSNLRGRRMLEAVDARLKKPTTVVKNYGGEELPKQSCRSPTGR